jgi:MoaA/NifB/PqqE/SkfB family radical SAM enzyme
MKSKSFSSVYKEDKLVIFVDISTYCNAGCPQCHRTNVTDGGLRKVDWLPLVRWTLDEFKEAYTPELVRKVAGWEICGTWGDPLMNKDMYEIAKYIIETNPYTYLTIDTNGSIRPLSWWKKLGELSQLTRPSPTGQTLWNYNHGRIRVDFAIEGINQEMHAKYRRFTDLKKVLANMKMYTDNGGNAKVFCVVHDHNKDYLQEISDMCKAHGAETVDFTANNRFYNNSAEFTFINENYEEESLHKATGEYRSPKPVRGNQRDKETRSEWLKKLMREVKEVGEEEDIH